MTRSKPAEDRTDGKRMHPPVSFRSTGHHGGRARQDMPPTISVSRPVNGWEKMSGLTLALPRGRNGSVWWPFPDRQA